MEKCGFSGLGRVGLRGLLPYKYIIIAKVDYSCLKNSCLNNIMKMRLLITLLFICKF